MVKKQHPTLTKEHWFHSALEFLFERTVATFAALMMFCMMLVTFFDVIGRYIFNSPIPGGFEITELLLASIIFLGLPMVTADNGHVNVDLLDSVIPKWLKSIQNKLINVLSVFAFGVMAWMLWQFAMRTYQYQDTTSVLEIPYAGLVFLMAISTSFTTLILVVKLLRPSTSTSEKES